MLPQSEQVCSGIFISNKRAHLLAWCDTTYNFCLRLMTFAPNFSLSETKHSHVQQAQNSRTIILKDETSHQMLFSFFNVQITTKQ